MLIQGALAATEDLASVAVAERAFISKGSRRGRSDTYNIPNDVCLSVKFGLPFDFATMAASTECCHVGRCLNHRK